MNLWVRSPMIPLWRVRAELLPCERSSFCSRGTCLFLPDQLRTLGGGANEVYFSGGGK